MKHALVALRRYFRRSSQSGQSVVLLALGFIALAGFVGITTDISLMFVRYAQLSRAVDSAAIAAANQMRQDRSNASVQLAARQFIEFYGISPESVIVDTCLTTNYSDPDLCNEDQSKLVRVRAYFRQPTVFLKLLNVPSFDMWVAATSQTAALDVVIVMDVSESMAAETTLQDWARTEKLGPDPTEPLTISKITNYGTIYRPPTVNEIILYKGKTDVDVPLFWNTWGKWDGTTSPLPGLLTNQQAVINDFLSYYPKAWNGPYISDPAANLLAHDIGGKTKTQGWSSVPEFRVDYVSNYFTDDNATLLGVPVGYYGPKDKVEPTRAECRVRFYPSANTVNSGRFRGLKNANGTFTTYAQLLNTVGLPVTPTGSNSADGKPGYYMLFDGFLPTYNYYGCCNDPDGDKAFDDLVCQPFKQVREATFGFLNRIDFLRGDRAAFVTYDRTAFLVNPYPYDTEKPTSEELRPGAMLDNKTDAYRTLKNLIGVRAEPYFYVMQPTDPVAVDDPRSAPIGYWKYPSAGFDTNGNPRKVNYGDKDPVNGYKPTNPAAPEAVNYPVQNNCFVQNAGLSTPYTLFPNGLTNASLPTEKPLPAGYDAAGLGYSSGWKNLSNGAEVVIQHNTATPSVRTSYNVDGSYENWAACRSGNIGAALREANNALLNPNTSRRFGTIWIIVLMSDGGAGASDPVRRNGAMPVPADPYKKIQTNPDVYGQLGEYGAYGLCPIGTPNEWGEVFDYGDDNISNLSNPTANVPYCADQKPESRHTCDFRPLLLLPTHPAYLNYKSLGIDPMEDNNYRSAGEPEGDKDGDGKDDGPPLNASPQEVLAWNKKHDRVYDVDIALAQRVVTSKGVDLVYGGCDPLYDVEDYARDWADYIAIANLGTTSANTQVPTIFTIGFAIEFTNRTGVSDTTKPVNDPANAASAQTNVKALCNLNIANCLGEQLLRYIADIGDNNRIDNDYYQDLMDEWYKLKVTPGSDLVPDGYVGAGTPFGSRDVCQYTDPANPYGEARNNTYDNGAGVTGNTPGDKILQAGEFANEWGQLRANVSCGNYYYSPSAQQLQFVFDDIASRMFTRLSR